MTPSISPPLSSEPVLLDCSSCYPVDRSRRGVLRSGSLGACCALPAREGRSDRQYPVLRRQRTQVSVWRSPPL
jgi:hypothetical protein